jgi:hypothetical protein
MQGQMTNTDKQIVYSLGLRKGELVRVRSRDEILATLDENGCLDSLPFMPEMLEHCGQSFPVSGGAHKTCDTISKTGGRRMQNAVHLADLRCDGAVHGGCQAACLFFWKEAWLERVTDKPAASPAAGDHSRPASPGVCSEQRLHEASCVEDAQSAEAGPRYVCQVTELVRATTYLPWWDVRQYVQDVRSGNVTLPQLANALYYRFTSHAMQLIGYRFWLGLYDKVQSWVGGVPYPVIAGELARTPNEKLDLQPGDEVEVKSLDEIVATLDKRNRNRGMAFDKEMAPFCGERHRVFQRVDRIIDEGSGRMLEFKNDCIMLEGVVCRSRYSDRRIACPRAIYSYWREGWLRRVDS